MATTAADCTCATQCPSADHCICMWVYDEGKCYVDCPAQVVIGPATIERASLDSQVKIDASGVELGVLGEFLDRTPKPAS